MFRRFARHGVAVATLIGVASVTRCGGGGGDVAGPPNTIEVVLEGTGSGTVTSGELAIQCPDTCGPVDWIAGGTMSLTAAPAADSVFIGWSGGGCSGTGTCDLVCYGHVTVTATFDLIP